MMSKKVEKFGTVPEGAYIIVLDDIKLLENVVSIPKKVVSKEFWKVIGGKEKSTLSEEIIRQIDTIDLGADGLFPDGQEKPRYQNKVDFVFHEKQSLNRLNVSLYGGPRINKALKNFIEQVLGITIDKFIAQTWGDMFKAGDEFNCYIKMEGEFNRIDDKTVRKVGLPPLENSEGVSNLPAGELSPTAKALLKYVNSDGVKGVMAARDIVTLHTKNITVDGITLSDYGQNMQAWGEITKKYPNYKDANGNVNITE